MAFAVLDNVDLSGTLKRAKYERMRAARQQKFVALHLKLGGQIGGQLGPRS